MTAICDARLIYGTGWISQVFIYGGTLTIHLKGPYTVLLSNHFIDELFMNRSRKPSLFKEENVL